MKELYNTRLVRSMPEFLYGIGPKRDPGKLAIALRVRKETTLPVKEIAARLHLGTPASASLCLLAMSKISPANLTQGRFAI